LNLKNIVGKRLGGTAQKRISISTRGRSPSISNGSASPSPESVRRISATFGFKLGEIIEHQ